MNGKFIVYALVVSLVCTAMSWASLLSGDQGGNSYRSGSGSTWSSNSSYGGGSWGGGGHK